MIPAFTFFLVLAWLTPALAGSITLDFKLQGKQCVIANSGDASAFYPLVYQLGSNGQWAELDSGTRLAELPPGGEISARLTDIPASSGKSDIGRIQAILVHYFDQSGVSSGQVVTLRPPPEVAYRIDAAYVGNRFRIYAPAAKDGIRATWLLAPLEEGIAPIARPVEFRHRQPPTPRIDWGQRRFAEIEVGPALPAVTMVHETADGLVLQKIRYGRAKRAEQRTAWLNMTRVFYSAGIACGLFGMLFFVSACRSGRKRAGL